MNSDDELIEEEDSLANAAGITPPDILLKGDNIAPKVTHPWDYIHLSKVERKGKTYEELQEIRKEKWYELNNKSVI